VAGSHSHKGDSSYCYYRDIFVEGSEIDVDPAIPLNGLVFFYRSPPSAERLDISCLCLSDKPNRHNKI